MPDFGQNPNQDEEKKDKLPETPAVEDVTDKEDSSEDLDAQKEETQDKVDSADEEIGVQEVQSEVKKAASTHVSEEAELAALQDDLTDDVDSFGNKIDGVLQDAGLSKKHVYFCCGGVFFLAIVGLIVFFGIKFIIGVFPDDDTPPDPDDDTPPVVDIDEDQVWVHPSIYGGLLLGTDLVIDVGQGGTQESIDVGVATDDFADIFAYRLEQYEKIVNAYNMDVNDYLNNFSDRSQAVDDLIVDYQAIYDEGLEIREELVEETDEMSVLFDANDDTKAFYEAEFFAQFVEYDGGQAVEYLDSFVAISQEQADIKAHYQANAKLYDAFSNSLPYLGAKIEDVTINKEALVKGVQVVDIKGSDLELIFDQNLE